MANASAPFGRVLVAMATPFGPDGELDLDAAQKTANYLVESGADGIVVSGTTGESPTTTVAEDKDLLAAVVSSVSDRAAVIAGVGTNDTRHSIALAKNAAEIGADGLLIVTPYYSKPSQAGVINHVESICAAGDAIPAMLYDIPGRTGLQLSEDTIVRLAQHEAVLAVKDATGDLERGTRLMAETDVAWYSGDDALNLPWLALGAAGVVSVVGHVAAAQYAHMVSSMDEGDLIKAREINNQLIPAVKAIMGIVQGAVASKAALQLLGVLDNRVVRPPLLAASDEEVRLIEAGLMDSGLLVR